MAYSYLNVSSITNTLLGAASLTASTTPTSGSNDDGYWALSLPFSVSTAVSNYSTIYIGTNSYWTFGGGSTVYGSSMAINNPTYDKFFTGWQADWSCQRIYYGTEGSSPTRTFRIRWEGTASTSGTLGSPTILWELTFYESDATLFDLQFAQNAGWTSSGLLGAYTASGNQITLGGYLYLYRFMQNAGARYQYSNSQSPYAYFSPVAAFNSTSVDKYITQTSVGITDLNLYADPKAYMREKTSSPITTLTSPYPLPLFIANVSLGGTGGGTYGIGF